MRTTIALFAALTATTLTAAAQSTAAPTKPAPPTLGPLVSYQYWPTQYIQFLTGPELPYSMFMFEADTSDGKHPSYHASFTTRDGKRVNYSNTDALTLYYKASGEESYKTDFAVEIDDSDKVGAASTVRFSTHDEKPVEFRFVQGSDISAQGSGLQPIPDAPIPIFAYRELGAVAGEGTALKIGDTVSTAEVWKEISHPPYFVAYRGAITSSAHTIVFYKGTQTWTVAKYPAALTAGNTWELDDDRRDHLTLKIDKVDGTHFTLSATDRFHPAVNTIVEATRTGDTFTTDRVLYMPAAKGGDKHTVALTFTPGLSTTATASTMDLSIAKKKAIATATSTATGDAADRTSTLQFTAPAWATNKSLTEETKTTGDAITVTAH
ncbi:hypothetical protein [Terriglobus aquaticus]|uniref:Uncharacterized protein n=1 Tax=Terriglobus aquaticus TaxID=940139 RepID=A0ABW9KGW8_9BACT|nr:hypothetical protein [Terriglobus aquaticus]